MISGRKLAQQIRQEARHEVQQWVAAGNRRLHLSVVLVGEDPASHSYVLNKTKLAANVGKCEFPSQKAPFGWESLMLEAFWDALTCWLFALTQNLASRGCPVVLGCA